VKNIFGGGMLDTRLILIDGIAGSGKSTIGQRLYRQLHLNGRATEFYHEFHRPHPILDIEADSVIDWTEQSVAKWRAFVQRLSGQNNIVVADGAVFQCGVGELLERDADDGVIMGYLQTVVESLKPLRPVLLYLYQNDIKTSIEHVREQRPAAWRDRVVTMFSNTPYGRNRTLEGFDLYLDFNRSLRRLADSSFDIFAVPKLKVENSDYQWDMHFDEICRFLDLPHAADPFQAEDYQGEYEELGGERHCRMTANDIALSVEGLFKIKKCLLPKQDDTVFVQTWPDELTFAKDQAGKVVSFSSTGPWDRLGNRTWIRVNRN